MLVCSLHWDLSCSASTLQEPALPVFQQFWAYKIPGKSFASPDVITFLSCIETRLYGHLLE